MTRLAAAFLFPAALTAAPVMLPAQATHCVPFVPRETGISWSYVMSYSAKGEFDMARLFADKSQSPSASNDSNNQRVATTVEGTIHVFLVRSRRDTVVARLQGDVTPLVEGALQAANVNEVRAFFARGFDVVYDSSGTVIGLRILSAESPSGAAVAFAKAVVSSAQFSTPCAVGSGLVTRWTRREEDPNGIYSAAYSVVSRPRPRALVLRKNKGPYFVDSPTASSTRTPIQIRSRAIVTAELDVAQQRITSLSGLDSQVVSAMDTQFGNSITRIRLRFAGAAKSRAPQQVMEASGDYTVLPLYVDRVDSASSRRMSTRTLAGNELADVLRGLRELNSTNGSAAATTRTFRMTKAFVLLKPSEVDSLASALRTERGDSPAFHTLSAALSSAGTPAAEKAIANALLYRVGEVVASRRLVAALGAMDELTGVGIRALQSAFREAPDTRVAAEAAIALGSAARALARTNAPRADSILGWLGAAAASPSTEEQHVAAVNALGASGSGQAVTALVTALSDSSANVRAAAAAGLSELRDSVTTARLLRVLRTDSSTLVRSRVAVALDSIGRNSVLMDGEREALLSERDAGVRAQLVKNLWAVKETWPELVTLMRRLQTMDPADEVKELIAKLFSSS